MIDAEADVETGSCSELFPAALQPPGIETSYRYVSARCSWVSRGIIIIPKFSEHWAVILDSQVKTGLHI